MGPLSELTVNGTALVFVVAEAVELTHLEVLRLLQEPRVVPYLRPHFAQPHSQGGRAHTKNIGQQSRVHRLRTSSC